MRGLNTGSFAIKELIQYLTLEILNIGNNHEFFLYFNQSDSNDQYRNNSKHTTIRIKKIKNRFLFDQVYLPIALQKDNIDITLFFKNTVPLLNSSKSAVIVHDLGYFYTKLNPYKFLDTLYMKQVLSFSMKKAKYIFSVSQYTKNDITRILGTNPAKITVCHEGISENFSLTNDKKQLAAVKSKYSLPEKFIFFPTSLSPRKNLIRTLKAFNQISNKIPHSLYITGGQSWNSNKVESLLEQSAGKVKKLGAVPAEDMPSLYQLADFAIYPSLFEGFGVPILEAFHCECPILTSNITSMPEIAGDAALLVDPYSEKSIADGIIKLATNKKLKNSLIKNGIQRTKHFSYEKTARIILNTIENNLII